MKITILTSVSRRHNYFCNVISEAFSTSDIQILFFPKVSSHISNRLDESALVEHMEYYRMAEDRIIPNVEVLPGLSISPLEINNDSTRTEVKKFNPDLLLVFGTPILREKWFDLSIKHKFNLHLGLSPYYRGSGTLVWPFLNNEPQFAGITFHELTQELDMGKYLFRIRKMLFRKIIA